MTMPDLFYSFGTCHPGAVTLHNYPRHLQNLTRDDGKADLIVDVLGWFPTGGALQRPHAGPTCC